VQLLDNLMIHMVWLYWLYQVTISTLSGRAFSHSSDPGSEAATVASCDGCFVKQLHPDPASSWRGTGKAKKRAARQRDAGASVCETPVARRNEIALIFQQAPWLRSQAESARAS
jgi:hypothetical protein